MSGISYKDLVNDLSKVLISFLEPLNLKFYFGDDEIQLKEVFMKSGLMPLFLYDKQPFINYSLRHKKVESVDEEAFAKLHMQTAHSFLNFKFDIIHNLFNDDLLKTEQTNYDFLVFSLATKILSEDSLTSKGNNVYLDSLYVDFVSYMATKNKENKNESNRSNGV